MNLRNAKFKCENCRGRLHNSVSVGTQEIIYGKADAKSYWQILLTVSAYAV